MEVNPETLVTTTTQATTQATEATEKPATPTPPVKEDPQFSERFSSLLKKEKTLLREREQARALKEALSAREAELAKREESVKRWESLNNPVEALKLKGWSYEDVTNAVLNEGKVTPELEIKSVNKRMDEWEKAQQLKEQERVSKEKEQVELEKKAIVDQFKLEIQEFYAQGKDTWELMNTYDPKQMVDLAYETIDAYFNKHQKALSLKEACDMVEEYLEKEILLKAKGTKKFAKLLTPETKPLEDKKPVQSQSQAQTRTLTNNLTSSPSAGYLPAKQESDRIARALAALER